MKSLPLPKGLRKLRVKNYRSLADAELEIEPINILFGPNGAGKSSLLDTLWFLRDCAIRGVDQAASDRSHGIGLLWDAAEPGETLSILMATEEVEYQVNFQFSGGRIDPFAGERLSSHNDPSFSLLSRSVGSVEAGFRIGGMSGPETVSLRDPSKLSLEERSAFIREAPDTAMATGVDRLLRSVRFFASRSFDFFKLRKFGSEVGHQTRLGSRAAELWSVLRNLHDRRFREPRYDTILQFMREAFPNFRELALEQTGPNSVYASFIESHRSEPVWASGVSDGHLQLLILLTTLFSEDRLDSFIVLLDEPEISLHPWALSVFAKAVKLASKEWGRQVFIATHSPVLMSQFEPQSIIAAEIDGRRTQFRRITEIPEIQDLLQDYAVGSLYMADLIAPQGKPADYPLNEG